MLIDVHELRRIPRENKEDNVKKIVDRIVIQTRSGETDGTNERAGVVREFRIMIMRRGQDSAGCVFPGIDR